MLQTRRNVELNLSGAIFGDWGYSGADKRITVPMNGVYTKNRVHTLTILVILFCELFISSKSTSVIQKVI